MGNGSTGSPPSATDCRVILEYKRSGVFKTRCVIQGFREAFALLDGADFKYASDVAGLAAVRNLVFDPIDPGEDIQISSIDIAQAYLQSDFFPETDPPRFLKVKDPITGDMRYYRQHGVLYGAKSSGVRWQNMLHPFLVSLGFIQGRNEPCAFFHPEKKMSEQLPLAPYTLNFHAPPLVPLPLSRLTSWYRQDP